ncbi:MAG TPA: rod shape-determining protein MreC [Firmicutes bacterium]|jgi:rod shape-determining protein MreC|nr:rod shape-determining protein MreC [Bacillota bacterium]
MPEQERNYKYLLLAVATVLLTLLMSIAAKQGGKIDPTEGFLQDVLMPVQKVILAFTHKIDSTINYVSEIRRLGVENEHLETELAQLKAKEHVMIEIWNENVRLRKLLDLPPAMEEFNLLPARVVARDPSNWYETMVIDQGTEAGVQVGSVVVTNAGVVGRVNKVSTRSAEVLLISDQRSAIGAMGQTSRDVGIVKGGDSGGDCRLVYLPRSATIRTGETVITSGLGGVFPKGLVLGRVAEVSAEDYGLGKFARVQPAVDLDHLEEVLVVIGS